MAEHEIRTITTLTNKRDEIIRVISRYERKLEQARADLVAIKAAIVVFQKPTGTADAYAYSDLSHLFRYGELGSLCLAALAGGPLSTPAIAAKVAEAKGFDMGDKVLLKSLTYSVICSMRGMEARRKARRAAKGRYVTWAMPLRPV